MSITDILIATAAVLLAVAAALVVVRMTLGPSMLDRAISFDVLAAVVLGAIGLDVAAERDADGVPILLVLTLLGFVGSVSIARFFHGTAAVDEAQMEPDPRADVRAEEGGS